MLCMHSVLAAPSSHFSCSMRKSTCEWIHFQGKQLCHLNFASLLSGDQHLQERVASHGAKPFLSRIHFRMVNSVVQGYKQEVSKLSPFVNKAN